MSKVPNDCTCPPAIESAASLMSIPSPVNLDVNKFTLLSVVESEIDIPSANFFNLLEAT